jgi:hypothetical protein
MFLLFPQYFYEWGANFAKNGAAPPVELYEAHRAGPMGLAYLRRGHIHPMYYQNLMYIELRISDVLHKKIYCIGPGLCGTSENSD